MNFLRTTEGLMQGLNSFQGLNKVSPNGHFLNSNFYPTFDCQIPIKRSQSRLPGPRRAQTTEYCFAYRYPQSAYYIIPMHRAKHNCMWPQNKIDFPEESWNSSQLSCLCLQAYPCLEPTSLPTRHFHLVNSNQCFLVDSLLLQRELLKEGSSPIWKLSGFLGKNSVQL